MSDSVITFTQPLTEANRQLTVCNACRYCEGFCAVFPAAHSQRAFATGDIVQLANLCHNCRGCYYACQFSEPHEYAINLPQALANVRTQSWQHYVTPSRFAALFQRHGVAIAAVLVVTIAILFYLLSQFTSDSTTGNGFYAYLSHGAMVLLFTPAFVVPLLVISLALKRYWHAVGGQPVRLRHVRHAMIQAGTLRHLDGGQGQGCNYESGDRYSNARRIYHQFTLIGFLLCFLSTSTATVMHYGFALEAPYPLLSLPKLFGVIGGCLLTLGCAGLLVLKSKADASLGTSDMRGGETAFVLLLGATGLTGLALYAATDTTAMPALLAIHLGTVLAFFITMPYTKMVHGFFRMAALVRDAQRQQPHAATPKPTQ